MTTAFIFPGQGSQSVGMGKALAEISPAARAIFEQVDEALKQSLTRLMFEGPEDQLTLTANAQPAIMASSLAALAVLEAEGGIRLAEKAGFVAGHSLGEYSALAAAGAIPLDVTAKLLRRRGEAMQAAVPPGEGAMAAILGLGLEDVQAIAAEAAEGEVCTSANDNAPGQVVVSGHKGAVERAILLAKAKGSRHAVLLPVSAPFHCPLMAPAAEAMAQALDQVAIATPLVPVFANVTAAPVADPATIKTLLVQQVTGTVRWRESVLAMQDAGVTRLVEFGGKVLGPMVKRIAPDIQNLSVVKPDDIEAVLKAL
ncbi:ACP S-malonyltransferase [Sandaracinobacter neustonicus]|uniref:Malonyl CoA-acyl carrier protein transacylase n=1 Tax=Sandaracinobacter neustonicus TaxID=1715348 RepID=A0A501XGC1_9SPHN|nr:ACP S-malonyltransferase [Sandaracinobacter neustonicus]TPE59449.1 ACP S-malonyltransferase [Sandaracinobacter neustonicus]